MADALAHRGPDGQGFFSDAGVALGHRRLAIIDREGGEQPMTNEDRSVWIVFNGEIYNHAELRALLTARGHQFRTHSDTEVIVHAYEEYGDSCIDRLDGMFAFAVYDQRQRRTLVARDRLGKKPLFYAIFRGVVHFASEIKAIAASPYWSDEIDEAALEGYFELGYVLAPATVYRHVRKLEPGHRLVIERGRVETRRYWDIGEFDTDRRDSPVLERELDERLSDAVRRRLESEVPLGAFLSGGVDSGLVVSYMAGAQTQGVITTSVGFDSAAHNELELAGATAERYATRHATAIIAPAPDDVLDAIVTAFDEPFADASAIPTYYVSQIARAHVTVALSGDGGDEVFGGYDFRYTPHAMEAAVRPWISATGTRALAGWLGPRWPRSRRLPRALRLGNVLTNLGTDAATAYYNDLCFMKPATARGLLGFGDTLPSSSPIADAVTSVYRACDSTNPIQRAQYADLKIYLPNGPLVKVDRMSMAHGLEVRSPLLDHHLVEFAFRIPAERKAPHGHPKALLRQLARRRLPEQVVAAKKHGFTAPIGDWIAGPQAERFRSDVLSKTARSASYIDQQRVAAWFKSHRAGQADHSHALWSVWVLERWARTARRRNPLVMPDALPAGAPC
jgi:asparagine synthase (glutamine-hydrolysing)